MGGPESAGEFKQMLLDRCLSQVGPGFFADLDLKPFERGSIESRAEERARYLATFVNELVAAVPIDWNEIRLLGRERRGQKSGPERT